MRIIDCFFLKSIKLTRSFYKNIILSKINMNNSSNTSFSGSESEQNSPSNVYSTTLRISARFPEDLDNIREFIENDDENCLLGMYPNIEEEWGVSVVYSAEV